MEFNMKQLLFYGDLCYVQGYGNSTWEVVGYTFEWSFLDGKVEEEIIYNVSNVHTGEINIACQEDVTLVCRAKFAYEYIRQLDKNGSPPKKPVNNTGKEKVKVNLDKKNVHTPYEYPDTLNGLLEELADLLSLVETIGEDEYLKQKISTVKVKLLKFKK